MSKNNKVEPSELRGLWAVILLGIPAIAPFGIFMMNQTAEGVLNFHDELLKAFSTTTANLNTVILGLACIILPFVTQSFINSRVLRGKLLGAGTLSVINGVSAAASFYFILVALLGSGIFNYVADKVSDYQGDLASLSLRTESALTYGNHAVDLQAFFVNPLTIFALMYGVVFALTFLMNRVRFEFTKDFIQEEYSASQKFKTSRGF